MFNFCVICLIASVCGCSRKEQSPITKQTPALAFEVDSIESRLNQPILHDSIGKRMFVLSENEMKFKFRNRKKIVLDTIYRKSEEYLLTQVNPSIVNTISPDDGMKDRRLHSYSYWSLQNRVGSTTPLVFFWDDYMAHLLELLIINDSGRVIDHRFVAIHGGEGGSWANVKSEFINDSVFDTYQVFGSETGGRSPGYFYHEIDSSFIKYLIRVNGKIDTLRFYHESRKDSLKMEQYGS